MITTGVDVGSATVKCALVESGSGGAPPRILAKRVERIRKRDPRTVVDETHAAMLADAGASLADVAYVASTGEGDWIPFATGHFYGMTTHARGALFFFPDARGAMDIGALHARAMLVDGRARVLGHRMTSQCASGSGQFLENIARYLGIGLAEVGELSLRGTAPEKPSGICAVLAETDVINMVSRGIRKENILKGIHMSMGERYVKLLRAASVTGAAVVTGGLAADAGLMQAMREEIARQGIALELWTHPDSILAGAIGAALWGAFRHERLQARDGAAA